MIKVRVSTLELFRKTVTTSYGDEVELIQRCQGNPPEPNWMMLAGTAWHACLEGKGQVFSEDVGTAADFFTRFGGYTFDSDMVDQAQVYTGRGLNEQTARRTFDLGGQQVEVQGTCDWISGLAIQDHKLKFTPSDPRDYEASLQWRFYLLLHDARVFRYNLWDCKTPMEDGYCQVRGVCSFRLWDYPGLEGDCVRWVREFVSWAGDRGLLANLSRKAA